MDQKENITDSARETEDVGLEFSKQVIPGDLILLTGELGAGKTTFVQGVAKGLLVKSRIISPTYVLVRKHRGKIGTKKIYLYHIDLYRLENISEVSTLGLDDIFEDVNGIFLIEWGEKHGKLKASYEIKFEILSNTKRKIVISSSSSSY